MKEAEIMLGNETFIAGTHRCLFHEPTKTLIVSDCHFGKVAHFRKNNIPLPQIAATADYLFLEQIITLKQPHVCVFLGDLFHSSSNQEWNWFQLLIKKYPLIEFILIEGNHDILPQEYYEKAGLLVKPEMELLPHIFLTHEPTNYENTFNICGHVHPGFSISGKGRQHLHLPCYYFNKNRLYMPAFGRLNGCVNMEKIDPGGKAWMFTENKIYLPQ